MKTFWLLQINFANNRLIHVIIGLCHCEITYHKCKIFNIFRRKTRHIYIQGEITYLSFIGSTFDGCHVTVTEVSVSFVQVALNGSWQLIDISGVGFCISNTISLPIVTLTTSVPWSGGRFLSEMLMQSYLFKDFCYKCNWQKINSLKGICIVPDKRELKLSLFKGNSYCFCLKGTRTVPV